MYYSVFTVYYIHFQLTKVSKKEKKWQQRKNMRSYKQADRKSYQIIVKYVTAQDTKASEIFLS